MSRSSGRERGSGGDGATDGERDRGSTQPIAALVAVLTVSLAFSAYAVGLERALPDPTDRDRGIAKPTLDRATDAVREGGAVVPGDLPAGLDASPDGYALNLTLSADGRTWRAGEDAPPSAETAARPVNVRLSPGEVVPGRLEVAVWA
jgi:hypothetical protein